MVWLLIIVGILLVTAFWGWISKPVTHKNVTCDRFGYFIKGLLDQTIDGSVMVIQHSDSSRFVQFVKYSDESGSILLFGFPDAPWSRDYIAPIQKAFILNSVTFKMSITSDENIPRFVEVVLKGQPEKIVLGGEKVACIALHAIGLTDSDRYQITYDADMKRKQ